MATVGLDCHLILDGIGYMIDPESYIMIRPRVRRADRNRNPAVSGAGADERYLDYGPGKREWYFTVVCFNAMKTYAGVSIVTTGEQFRDDLHTSYNKVNTVLSYTDPGGTVFNCRFDDLQEEIVDIRSQADSGGPSNSIQFYMHVTLVEST